MDIQSNGGLDFRLLGERFRRAGKGGVAIRRETTAAIQVELRSVAQDVKTAVMAVQSRGVKGHGARRRQDFYTVHHTRPRRLSHGLRASVARTITTKVTYTGYRLGARLYMNTSSLPRSQQRLPYYLDARGRWRHPVWGNRNRWVHQLGQEYFFTTIRRREDRVRAAVKVAVGRALKELR